MFLIKKSTKLKKRKNNKKIRATNETIHKIVRDEIEKNGNHADLNHIDVSQVTDMSYLFIGSPFYGKISMWDVSNVTNMSYMFNNSDFNGDISNWDVSNVTNMSYMFSDSQFYGDISNWDISNVTNINGMFLYFYHNNINQNQSDLFSKK